MLNTLKINTLPIRFKSYKISDGKGLFLLINPSGTKYWRFRYKFGGEKSLSLGRYPEVGLKEAREMRAKAAELLKQNVNPSTWRRQQKQQAVRAHANTFGAIALEWFEANQGLWTPRHAGKLWRVIERHLLPHMGRDPVTALKPRDVLAVLRKIEAKGATETSRRALWITRRIYNYAIAIDAAEANPAQSIGAGLKPHVEVGHPCIAVGELPTFLRKFHSVQARPQEKLAFRLLLLTALRTGELRRCKWEFVNLSTAELRLPKAIMKMRDDHTVPLSRQAVAALVELHGITGDREWLLPNQRCGKHPFMSENVINNLIAQMGYKERMVGHSFRKLFSTVLNEKEFNADAIERQLAHRERSKSRAAYNFASHLQTRRNILQWWADYLDGLTCVQSFNTSSNVFHPPARSATADFDRGRVDASFNAPEPSALTYGDNL